MNLVEFVQRFSDESACEEHLIQLRWKEGFRCPKCDSAEAMLVHAAHRRDAETRVPLFLFGLLNHRGFGERNQGYSFLRVISSANCAILRAARRYT